MTVAIDGGHTRYSREVSVRAVQRAMLALKNWKWHAAETLLRCVKKWRTVSGGDGGRHT